jgi:hypothetical protein
VHVASVLSPLLSDVTWVCGGGDGSCESKGEGDLDTNAIVDAGGSISYLISGFLATNASGALESSASLTAAPGYTDPNPANDTASDTDTIASDVLFANGFDD